MFWTVWSKHYLSIIYIPNYLMPCTHESLPNKTSDHKNMFSKLFFVLILHTLPDLKVCLSVLDSAGNSLLTCCMETFWISISNIWPDLLHAYLKNHKNSMNSTSWSITALFYFQYLISEWSVYLSISLELCSLPKIRTSQHKYIVYFKVVQSAISWPYKR